MTKSVLVTGASGLLGTRLCQDFEAQGWESFSLTRTSDRRYRPRTLVADIADRQNLQKELHSKHFDLCVHCAAITNLNVCEADPSSAFNAHVEGTRNVVDFIECNQLIYVSTDSVFDGNLGNYKEHDKTAPLNVYSKTKLSGEHEALRHKNPIIARLNLFGIRRQRGTSLAEWAFSLLEKEEPVPGFTNVFFNPLHTSQISTIFLSLYEKAYHGILHLGSYEKISKHAFICKLAKASAKPQALVIPTTYNPTGSVKKPLNTSLNTTLLQSILPSIDLDIETGIKAALSITQ